MDLPEGSIATPSPAAEAVGVARPDSGGRSPYVCPVGHPVVVEPVMTVRQLRRVDHLGQESEVVSLPVGADCAPPTVGGVSLRVAA
ncbi:hypothetical protein ACWGR4_44850 [Embleya sp. NPDC055664]